jgi:hypothetical protein
MWNPREPEFIDRTQAQPIYGERVLAFSARHNEWFVAYYRQKSHSRGYFEDVSTLGSGNDYLFDEYVIYWLPLPEKPS